ncbi:hypothetical protein [Azospirillum lipoferum]|uniref:Uncharacterized protein n=1 Tax=Azospirillum lipoferum (strain 4B) TaxID=862719 RepID=G7ZGR8_AZOL4|nr:hypothetical protein [Azospirillum lipoferum]CBS90482.1 exported protein of unknown function [Azospirillum lipoferum 4B]
MPGEGRTKNWSGSAIARTVAAALAVLVAAAALPAAAEPVAVQAPAKPRTDAFDCWLLDPDRLEQAADQGLCGDAFARAPDIASLPDAPPLPALTPPRKPKIPERRSRTSSRNSSHSESHAMGTSAARVSRTGGGGGDFFSNFQRDFRALTDLLGSGTSPRRGDGSGPGSHTSHRN